MTTWPRASITSSAVGGSCALVPTASITPSRANTAPSAISRRCASIVTSSVAWRISKVGMVINGSWTGVLWPEPARRKG